MTLDVTPDIIQIKLFRIIVLVCSTLTLVISQTCGIYSQV